MRDKPNRFTGNPPVIIPCQTRHGERENVTDVTKSSCVTSVTLSPPVSGSVNSVTVSSVTQSPCHRLSPGTRYHLSTAGASKCIQTGTGVISVITRLIPTGKAYFLTSKNNLIHAPNTANAFSLLISLDHFQDPLPPENPYEYRHFVVDPEYKVGAGRGNRTLMTSLEGWSFTTKLYPQKHAYFSPEKSGWQAER